MNSNSVLWIAFFVIGNILGSGFFMVPGALASIGRNMLYSWFIAGFAALIFGYVFGQLFILFPKSNVLSDYFEDITMKKTVALLYWLSCIVGNTGLLILITSSLKLSLHAQFVALIIVFAFSLLNQFFPDQFMFKLEFLLNFTKFALLLALPLVGLMFNYGKFVMPVYEHDTIDIFKLAITAFWAYLGIEATNIFGSGQKAKKGLLLGIVACTFLYILSSIIVIGLCDERLINHEAPFIFFVQSNRYLHYFTNYIGYLIAFTNIGALYGWICATSKMSLHFASSGLFHSIFLQKTKSGVSSFGLWTSSFLMLVAFYLIADYNVQAQFSLIADLCVYFTLILYMFCCYKLFMVSESLLDRVIASIGIFIVLVSFVFAPEVSLFAFGVSCLTFVVFYSKSHLC